MKGEPDLWFGRFRMYIEMGPNRTMLAVMNRDRLANGKQKVSHITHVWTKSCSYWRWRDRAAAYDDWLADERDSEILSTMRELNSKRLEIGRKLFEHVEKMLSHPLTMQKIARDGKTILIMPAKWRLADVEKLYTLGDNLVNDAMSKTPETLAQDIKSMGGITQDDVDINELREFAGEDVVVEEPDDAGEKAFVPALDKDEKEDPGIPKKKVAKKKVAKKSTRKKAGSK